MKFVFFSSYYNGCDVQEDYTPFEADSMDNAEYALLEVKEYNSTNPDKTKEFCGMDILSNDWRFSCKILTLDEWFDGNKRAMLIL